MRTKAGWVVLGLVSLLTPTRAAQAPPPDVELGIQAAEYAITAHQGRLQAPNRAHGFRSFFTEPGVRLVPRLETEAAWEWGLEWVGYGRANAMGPVPAATLSPQGSRIEYRRGALTEWYVNTPKGLEQGFELPAPPEGGDGPVLLQLALMGSLHPVVSQDGQSIDFLSIEGARVLRYAELHVTDARESVVPARMEGFADGSGHGIRLVVDDRDAVYPLLVDPVAVTPIFTAESDQATAEMGKSVGTAGDVNGDGYSDLIVGAPFYDNGQTDEGRAYVYLGSPSGLVSPAAWIVESDQAGARFGWTVGTAGDVNGDGYSDVIVGAPRYDNGQTDEGRAYVYLGSPSGLSTTAAWTNESNQASAQYATSVAAAGDVNNDGFADVVVGAPLYDNGQADEGRAFVYLGSGGGLAAAPVWTAESDLAAAQFGFSVSTAGDVNGDSFADVAVGAPLWENFSGTTDEGKAFVYHGNASGVSASPSWFQEGNQAQAQFGWSVSTAGDIDGTGYADLLVGAWQFTNDQTMEGRAFLYLGNSAGLAFFAITTLESDNANAYMGWSVAPAGDVNGDGYGDVLVTAPFYSTSVTTGGGRAYVYLGSEFGLASGPTWSVLRSPANCAYGWSAATAGDVNGDGFADIAVGAPWDENGQTNEGIVYVYPGSSSFISNLNSWTESNQVSAATGWSVATAGDVNGDGYADMIVGAAFYDDGEGDEGRAFLLLGSATGLISTAWLAEGNQTSAQFGASVSTAGDVNGDGYDDVIVSAPRFDATFTDEGKAFVYLGGAGGLAASPAWTTLGGVLSAGYGASVSTAGDVNGDGYTDVIVGAPQGTTGLGWVSVFLGSAAGLSTNPAWTVQNNQPGAQFGNSVDTAGDVNGDGYADVIIGAPFYDASTTDAGRAVVYLGSASGLAPTPTWTKDGSEFGGHVGWSVSGAGDTNGDGYADVIVGTPFAFPAHVDVYLGYNLGVFTTAAFTAPATGTSTQSHWGLSVAGVGDINGDGFADVAVGAPWFDQDQAENKYGWVYVFYGSATGLNFNFGSAMTSSPQQPNDSFGYSVAGAGDINGDGYADFVVGAPAYSNGQAGEGRAFVYMGGGVEGVALRPRQRSSDGTRAISRGLTSDSGTSFRLGALARTPYGRGKARLEWEVKPAGTFFNGVPTGTSATLADSGLTGGPLEEVVSNLNPATRYHWRVRLVYDQASVPFVKRSRWMTMPWAGWQEAMLRTSVAVAGAGRASTFTIVKAGGGVTMTWPASSSCNPADSDYAIYEGTLGNFTSHVPVTCATAPAHSWNFTPAPGNRYFLLVPINAVREGSYGLKAGGVERPVSASACKPQSIVSCP